MRNPLRTDGALGFAPRVIEVDGDDDMAPLHPPRPQVIVTERTESITPSGAQHTHWHFGDKPVRFGEFSRLLASPETGRWFTRR